MAKIIQVLTLEEGEYQTIAGLGSDGILYELTRKGAWTAISEALNHDVEKPEPCVSSVAGCVTTLDNKGDK